jgi:hypothetical protein
VIASAKMIRAAAALPGWAAGERGDLAALTCRRTPAASAPWRCHPIHDQRASRDPMPLQPLDQPNGLERSGPDGDLVTGANPTGSGPV